LSQQGDYSGMSKQVIPPDAAEPWVAEFSVPWIPSLGISFHLALDGLSFMMVALTRLLGVAAVAWSWNES
ncbi:NADH-quinone oxidoreductase subunit M, partial [Psychrobacter proteolyticus]